MNHTSCMSVCTLNVGVLQKTDTNQIKIGGTMCIVLSRKMYFVAKMRYKRTD